MSRNIVETVLGAVVLIVAIGFLGWAYNKSSTGSGSDFQLTAKFDQADGVGPGSDVRLSGIKIGQVRSQELDKESYRASLVLSLEEGIDLPSDSSAAIVSSGLLGGKYIALTPGADDLMLEHGDEISFTQSSVNLEDLIGQFIFSQSSSGDGS